VNSIRSIANSADAPNGEDASPPRVSIGIPVFNGERFLAQTLDGLLKQTFDDLEIIVSDNASTDSTPQLLAEYAARDPRVRVHRFEVNQGPAANYNKVAELARGEYFMWAAADDLHAATFVEAGVRQLDADPSTVLAYADTRIIDEFGETKFDYDYQPDIDSASAAERLDVLLNVDHHRHGAFEIFGLMRTASLRAALPQGAYARSDSVMLVRMALRGRFVRHREPLFLNRDHGSRSVRSTPTRSFHGRGLLVRKIGTGPIPADEWWDASRRNHMVWPEWRLLAEYRRALRAVDLAPAERRSARRSLRRFSRRHAPKLVRDVLLNTELGVRRAVAFVRRSHRNDTPEPPRSFATAPTGTLWPRQGDSGNAVQQVGDGRAS
jgi:glycosyltransferase involved in cell wall biosynthesis